MAQYRSGMGSGTLSPSDIPRPDVARDPGVTARPDAEFLGNPDDPRGRALDRSADQFGAATHAAARSVGGGIDQFANAQRAFSRDMSMIAVSFEKLAEQRRTQEDNIAVDHGQLLLAQSFEPIIQQKLSSPDTGKPDFLRVLDQDLVRAKTKVDADLKERGFTLSPEGQRRFEHASMQLRAGASRRAAVAANNQRVSLIATRADESIQEIARQAGATGDVDTAMTRVESTLGNLETVLTPENYKAAREKAATLVLETAIDGYIRRGRIDKAQALADRYTGFVKSDAGEAPKAIVDAAKARGVDPAVALAIVHVETGGKFDPNAKSKTSSARGLYQLTDDTARRLGLPVAAAQLPSEGLIEAGNIDLTKRPMVRMPDGKIATVHSMSFEEDGQEVLIPTVSDDGKLLSEDEARALYKKTGKHLGKFDTPENATTYGKALSAQQGAMYLPLGDQAAAGAALTADNTAALRRSLGSEPTPTDIYLAHFLGAPVAVRALKGDPGAKVVDVLNPDQIEANKKIAFKGKKLPDWTVGELYSWAQGRMAEGMKAANGMLDGRTVSASDAAVPIKSAMQLGHKVHNAATAERSRLRVVIKDDIASIKQTGVPVEIDEVAAAHILPAGEMVTWREDRESARAFFDATNDMASQPEAEIQRRVDGLKPQDGEVGFARRDKLYREVGKIGQDIIKLRSADPAGSVDETPAVMEAKKGFKQDDPKTYAPLIAARLAAQDQVGIPPERQSPITKDEALQLTEPLRRMLPGTERQVLTDLANTTKELFGEHADTAFKYALRANRVSRENTQTALRIAKKLQLGMAAGDERDEAAEDAAWAEVAAADRATYARIRESERYDMGERFYDPGGDINFMGEPSPAEPERAVPETDDIVALRKEPSRYRARFDAKYGEGAAKKILKEKHRDG